jgi:hypothetical protein
LRDYILLPDSLAAINELQASASNRQEEHRLQRLAILQDERKKLTKQITNLTRAISEHGLSQALSDKLTELEARRAQGIAEIRQLESIHYIPQPVLPFGQIAAQSDNLIRIITNAPTGELRQFMHAMIHKIIVKKEAGQLTGAITYYSLPPSEQPPPFDLPVQQGTGHPLPKPRNPLGAHSYRQTFTHPILFKKRP